MRFKTKYIYGCVLIATLALSLQNARDHYRSARRIRTLKRQVTEFNDLLSYRSLPLETLAALDVIPDEQLARGKGEMAKHKAVFTGIARDNGRSLPTVMRHIEHIGERFADYRVILFENDSSDATKMILSFWKLVNPKVEILSEDFHFKKRPSIKFMAEARNRYVKALESKEYAEFDIVIAVDMDASYGIDERGILDTFSKIDEWEVVCSNGIYTRAGHMWDAFAFRNEEFPDSPHSFRQKYAKDYWNEVSSIQKIYPPEADLLPVHSGFGGLAIYKRKVFENCFYDSIHEDCEHVALHEMMKEKHEARIYMNPAQIIRYEHYR